MNLINLNDKQKKSNIKKHIKIWFNLYKVQKRQKGVYDLEVKRVVTLRGIVIGRGLAGGFHGAGDDVFLVSGSGYVDVFVL